MARKIRPLTADRVADLPDPCSCCVEWETAGAPAPDCVPAEARAELVTWVGDVRAEWGDCGRIAYENGDALGFVKYAPPRFFPQARSMAAGVPDDGAVLIACLNVVADVEDAGLAKVLLQAALRDLVSRGERVVEAYAASESADPERRSLMTLDFLLKQGFEVVRPNPIRPLMRLELKTLASWTESVEAVLDALQLPRRVAERVPAPLVSPMTGGETHR